MHLLLLIGVAGVILAALAIFVFLRKHNKSRVCAICGKPAKFGFSHHAESPINEIAPLCFNCLKTRLSDAYKQFPARALVIEPTAGFPCYVFQPISDWSNRKLGEETGQLLSKLESTCGQCGSAANFLWLTSKGLQENNQQNLLAEGISETLLRWGNNLPSAVCGPCCVSLICKSIESRGLTFLEVCGPHSENGFVLPMAY
jgi:hypothetical protein